LRGGGEKEHLSHPNHSLKGLHKKKIEAKRLSQGLLIDTEGRGAGGKKNAINTKTILQGTQVGKEKKVLHKT